MKFTFFCRIAMLFASAALGIVLVAPSVAQDKQALPSADPNLKYTANKHLKQGLDCTACHGDGPKKPVTGSKCLECHESYDAIAKRTQDMEPNPHDNHQTMQDISCTECHKGHHTDVVFCQQCHGDMKLVRNSKK